MKTILWLGLILSGVAQAENTFTMPLGSRAREGRDGAPTDPVKPFPEQNPATGAMDDRPTTIITGRCILDDPDSQALQIPCPNLKLGVLDKAGKKTVSHRNRWWGFQIRSPQQSILLCQRRNPGLRR